MFHTRLKFVFALLVLVSSPVAFADIIIQPPGLNVGDQYRLVFVTSGTRDSLSSDIAYYNSFVAAQAAMSLDLVSLNTSWNAIGSTSTIDARDNTGTNPLALGVPIYRLDGALIAASNVQLWSGSLAAPILFDQFGNQASTGVHTGTQSDGSVLIGYGFGDVSGLVSSGLPSVADSMWTNWENHYQYGFEKSYAMSEVLTVTAVPEPSSLILLGLGSCAWSWARLRRKKKS